MKERWLVIVSAAVVFLTAMPAHAQATRTWVSGVGDDVNPCSRTAPCKTFAGAISKTAAGGEINVLDPGGFGQLTINRSISIVAGGMPASVTFGVPAGVTIRAGANDFVSIDGVHFDGTESGTWAFNIISAGRVDIRNCGVAGVGGAGGAINLNATTAVQVYVSKCTLFANSTGVMASSTVPSFVYLDDVQIKGSTTAVAAAGQAAVYISNSSLVGNGTALSVTDQGQIISFGNNVLAGNQTDGKPTGVVPLR
jgi:hypothetical protein